MDHMSSCHPGGKRKNDTREKWHDMASKAQTTNARRFVAPGACHADTLKCEWINCLKSKTTTVQPTRRRGDATAVTAEASELSEFRTLLDAKFTQKHSTSFQLHRPYARDTLDKFVAHLCTWAHTTFVCGNSGDGGLRLLDGLELVMA